jgi:hypothetical protein
MLNNQEGIEELKGFPERSSTESDVIFKNGEDGGREARLQEDKCNSNKDDILFTARNNSWGELVMLTKSMPRY